MTSLPLEYEYLELVQQRESQYITPFFRVMTLWPTTMSVVTHIIVIDKISSWTRKYLQVITKTLCFSS